MGLQKASEIMNDLAGKLFELNARRFAYYMSTSEKLGDAYEICLNVKPASFQDEVRKHLGDELLGKRPEDHFY
jgi:hypothetical protein|tara:strand:- start:2167 stop:2385 length:219 start_codon:yes stop_codon:yes gene_type:complete